MNPVAMSDSDLHEVLTAPAENPVYCTRAEALDEVIRRTAASPSESLLALLTLKLNAISAMADRAVHEGTKHGSVKWRDGLERVSDCCSSTRASLNGLVACA